MEEHQQFHLGALHVFEFHWVCVLLFARFKLSNQTGKKKSPINCSTHKILHKNKYFAFYLLFLCVIHISGQTYTQMLSFIIKFLFYHPIIYCLFYLVLYYYHILQQIIFIYSTFIYFIISLDIFHCTSDFII